MVDQSKIENASDFSDMPLTAVLKQWMTEMEWGDEIEVNDDRNYGRVRTEYSIDNQDHRLFLEVDEKREWFSVFLYGPVNVPPPRRAIVADILNRVNLSLGIGRIACPLSDNPMPVQFLARIDVEGSTFTPNQIHNMLKPALGTYEEYGDLLTAAALTKQTADQLWENFLAEQAAKEAAENEANEFAENDEGPTEL